jgi:pyridoxine/pyridoxamine 5'-phosphate oxidase
VIFPYRDGKPSNRIVALNGVDKRGFKFYTDTDNQLVSDLNSNPNAALVFYWESLTRQVRVEGKVIGVAEEEMKSDFSKYSFETQLSFYINDHSSVVKNKQVPSSQMFQVLPSSNI